MAHVWRGVIREYSDRLPVTESTRIITLGEGGTPLIEAPKLSEHTGNRVLLKFEGMNPTGSFKDRGMTMAITSAIAEGAEAVVCASTGNTSAAAAAYAAQAGITCAVLVPNGKIAMGKLSQAIAHGAQLIQVEGNFDDCLNIARKLSENYPAYLVNSVNPARIEGQKTASFEVVDLLGDAPDYHFLPVGNAGNITAYWKGYKEYASEDTNQAGEVLPAVSTKLPKMMGFQAAGAAPLVAGHPILEPETIATAIRIGNPASADLARAAVRESGGLFDMATDDEIMHAYNLVAQEGVFCEPASATPVAGLLKMHAAGRLTPGQTVVAVLTGNGLKDPNAAMRAVEAPKGVEANMERVLESIL